MTQAPSFIKPTDAAPSGDKLEAVRIKAREARDTELTIADLEDQLDTAKKALNELRHKTLPDLFDQAGIDKIGLPAEGNFPAYDIALTPFYSANIAASWPPEKRAAAFKALEDLGHGDLIKTDVVLSFPREQRNEARAVASDLSERGLEPQLKEGVHPQTLTAFVKEQVESGKPLPPLDVIGATVGRVAKMKERK